jgi:hypothetical protein
VGAGSNPVVPDLFAVRVTDVKPLPPKVPNGTAIFYVMIAWVFGGYIASTLIGLRIEAAGLSE